MKIGRQVKADKYPISHSSALKGKGNPEFCRWLRRGYRTFIAVSQRRALKFSLSYFGYLRI